MSGCTGIGKPQVAILMAVYEPDLEWLRAQLCSLEKQTYSNLCLYIRDDASQKVSFHKIQSCVQDCITAFPFFLQRNEENIGSNRTFQRLTQEAKGDYFAYCDQDDVWLSEKIETLVGELEARHVTLACSDVAVIDADGRQIADSITELRPRHIFRSGEGVAGDLIYRNFVIGCTMLLPAWLAREACPFAEDMVHDHYLALYAALHGAIYSHLTPLIQYRIHGGNQTGVLSHITDKASYIDLHLGGFVRRVDELSQRFSFPELERARCWAEARVANSRGDLGGAYRLWKLRAVNPSTSYFELVGLRLPDVLFRKVVQAIRKGKI